MQKTGSLQNELRKNTADRSLFNGTTNPLDPDRAGSWTTVYERTGETEIIDYVTLDQPVLAQFARITVTGISK